MRLARRPEAVANRQITRTSLAILESLRRYRILPTSIIKTLIGSNEKVIYRHLRRLFDKALVGRFPLIAENGLPGEMVYYLDSTEALDLLAKYRREKLSTQDKTQVQRIRERWRTGRRLFVDHELMISRLRAMLERACRQSEKYTLDRFEQGSSLWRWVEVPKVEQAVVQDQSGRIRKEWRQGEGSELLPLRPDALFTISNQDTEERLSFFYEADRQQEDTNDIMDKMRAYFHLIVRTKRAGESYGTRRVRAVLFETRSTRWADELIAVTYRKAVSNNPSNLFWFTSSEFFTKPAAIGEGRGERLLPAHLAYPEMIFDQRWASPDTTLHSLIDF